MSSPNTIPGFKHAIKTGADGIEADICLNTDDQILVKHPDSSKPVQLLKSELKITPTIDELVDLLIENPKIECLWDIKQNIRRLVALAVLKVTEAKLENRVYFTASDISIPFIGLHSNGQVLLWAKEVNPQVKIHVIDTFPVNLVKAAARFNADMVSFGWFDESAISRRLFKTLIALRKLNIKRDVKKAHEKGVAVLGGIPNDREGIIRLVAPNREPTGIDAILTDYPQIAFNLREEMLKTNPE